MNSATNRFETCRKRLLGLAYRMLGTRADAEDIVQDAWFKWMQTDRSQVESEEAYLTTIVTRLCLDRIKRERSRRASYVGPWLPEPIPRIEDFPAESVDDLAEDLSFALLLALERLSSLERAAFLLHDVFDVPFREVASMLHRSDIAVRQLAARARRYLRQARSPRPASREAHAKLLRAFLAAAREGDEGQLKALLHDDALLITDTGGHRPAANRPIRGAHRIGHLLAVTRRKFSSREGLPSAASISVNGMPGVFMFRDGTPELVITIAVSGERIAVVYVQANPDKLARIPISPLR